MATCPRCKGHLTDTHRCPRSRVSVGTEIAGVGLAGGLVGLLVLAAFDPRGTAADMDVLAFASGALILIGCHRLVRR